MTKLRNIFLRQNSRPRLIGIAVMACCVLGLIAYASIPDANGVIHGCYKRGSGTLRVIDDAVSQCDSNEIPIQWNETGPPGAPAPPRLITVSTASGTFGIMGCSDAIRSVNFVKQSATSRLRITYHDDGFVEEFNPGGSREFGIYIKIDGSPVSPTPISSEVQGDLDNEAVLGSVTMFGYANGLAAGPHTLATYYNNGTTCWRGNAYTIEIEEIEFP